MIQPIIGFVGMTHLGLVSGISAAEKGFRVICFDHDADKVNGLNGGILPVSEPQLNELVIKNRSQISFTDNVSDLKKCDVVYVAPDIATDDFGKSDLTPIDVLLNLTFDAARNDAVIIVLSQVPPGFSRARMRLGRELYYQVETLIFGRAVERALYPERYIIGCADPMEELPVAYEAFLVAHNCPILKMRYESAELAKISINMCLVASISTANILAELCEKIGANWTEILPALRLDKRIGPHSYLNPGLGISGGNLERDLTTFISYADEYDADSAIVKAWILNSERRKVWPLEKIKNLLGDAKDLTIAIWGIAYKENTHSTKNSPTLIVISGLQDHKLNVYDPLVPWDPSWHPCAKLFDNPMDAAKDADVLVIMNSSDEFKKINPHDLVSCMRRSVIIDPFKTLDSRANAVSYLYLGGVD